VGGFLRQASLDELPQLWNVLRGDMSLVGPRPLHPTTVARLSDEQKGRHRVRPGVTGWAVLNGRNSIPYSRRIELDNWYIENWSLGLDLRILLRTVPAVVFRSGLKMDQLAAEIDDLQGQPLAHSERSGD
jgi:sugar transferase EpsL